MPVSRSFFNLYLVLVTVLIGISCTKSASVHGWEDGDQEAFITLYKRFEQDSLSQSQIDSIGLAIFKLKNTKKNRAFLASYIDKTNANRNYLDFYSEQANIAVDSQDIANSYFLLGTYFDRNFIIDSSYYYFNQAKYHFRKQKDSLNLQKTYIEISKILEESKVYPEAEDQMRKAILLNTGRLTPKEKFTQEYALGMISLGLEQYEEAVVILKKALELIESSVLDNYYTPTELRLIRANTSSYLATSYIYLQEYDIANELIENTLLHYIDENRTEDSLLYSILVHNLGAVKLAKDEQDLALKYIKESLRVNTKNKNLRSVDFTYILLAQYYYEKGEMFTATTIIHDILDKSELIKDYQMQKEALIVLLQYDTENSKENFKRYLELDETINRNSNNVRNRFARLKYEADELMETNDKLKNQKDIIIMVSFIIILIVLSILIFFFTKHKLKEIAMIKMFQKDTEKYYDSIIDVQNKIASVQEAERKRIAKEIHDGVLNKLFITRFSLMQLEEDSIEKTRDLLVKEVQDVERFIRDSSHALSNEEKLFVSNFKQLIIELVFVQNRNLDTKFDVFIDPRIKLEDLSHRYKINIYRIVQEALQNVQKYADAKNCYVSFTYKTNTLFEVSVVDNGLGFNVKTVKKGIGLRNIQERLNVIQSKLILISAKNKGTSLSFLVRII